MSKTSADHKYDDIIHLPHPVSSRRGRMSMIDRAAQFSPFAALTGYEDAIEETGRLTDRPVELDEDGKAMLNEKLRLVTQALPCSPRVTVTYFLPDTRKAGGAYVSVTGKIKKVDEYGQTLLMEDGTVIAFHRIYGIEYSSVKADTSL